MKLNPMKTALAFTLALGLAACDNNESNRNNIQGMVFEDPSITTISDQSIEANETSVVAFVVADNQSLASTLTVTASSDNQQLIPDAGLQIDGSGANRMLNITPISELLGSANITLTVMDSDGGSASTAFTVTVAQQQLTVSEFAIQVFGDDPNGTPRNFSSRSFISGGQDMDIYPIVTQ